MQMEGDTALVAAYELNGSGGGSLLSVRQLREAWQSPERPLWMHLDFRHADVGTYLDDIAGLDEAAIEALLEEDTRPRVAKLDRKSTRLNSSHMSESRMPSSA